MTTPTVGNQLPKTEAPKPDRETRPPTPATRRSEAPKATARDDRAAISARSQAAAARAKPDDVGDSTDGGRSKVASRPSHPPREPFEAASLARATSEQITAHPAVAVRAQANSNGAAVLAMLQ
jgi:hypothetical protein